MRWGTRVERSVDGGYGQEAPDHPVTPILVLDRSQSPGASTGPAYATSVTYAFTACAGLSNRSAGLVASYTFITSH